MTAINDGFPAVGHGPLLPVKYQGHFELYEPKEVPIWDIKTIDALLGGSVNLEALLSTYYTLTLLLIIEYHDYNDNMI